MGEFDNGLLSFMFAHIEGGVKHIGIYNDTSALISHGENTLKASMLKKNSLLNYTSSYGIIIGLPLYLH
jgi:hypothetical protein